MNNRYPITDRIELIAAQVRVLADLMLTGNDLKEADRSALALVMQDLADRLEQTTREMAWAVICPCRKDGEDRP